MRTIIAIILIAAPCHADTWKSIAGQTMDAELVGLDGGAGLFRKSDGRTVRVPLERLAPDDRARAIDLATRALSDRVRDAAADLILARLEADGRWGSRFARQGTGPGPDVFGSLATPLPLPDLLRIASDAATLPGKTADDSAPLVPFTEGKGRCLWFGRSCLFVQDGRVTQAAVWRQEPVAVNVVTPAAHAVELPAAVLANPDHWRTAAEAFRLAAAKQKLTGARVVLRLEPIDVPAERTEKVEDDPFAVKK